MPEELWGIMTILGPLVLLLVLVWLVLRRRSDDSTAQTYEGTKAEYADEERRRREGTDDL